MVSCALVVVDDADADATPSYGGCVIVLRQSPNVDCAALEVPCALVSALDWNVDAAAGLEQAGEVGHSGNTGQLTQVTR